MPSICALLIQYSSAGWVAYAVTAVVSAIGENTLMLLPDTACKLINGKNGYIRDNISWILGQVVRDYEIWMNREVRKLVPKLLDQKWKENKEEKNKMIPGSEANMPRPTRAGLCVSFYLADHATKNTSGKDVVYYSGFGIAIFQLGIAAIPCGIFGDWSILLLTAVGIALAFTTGSLSQWRREKWACRSTSNKTIVLTRGNGSQHAIVVRSDGRGLDLEHLSTGPATVDVSASHTTRLTIGILALLWILLLVSASGINNNIWFLMAVGGVGMSQNIFVAAWPRNPAAFGMPLTYKGVIGHTKVMDTLFQVAALSEVEEALSEEAKRALDGPALALSMRDTFFPGKIYPNESTEWDAIVKRVTG